MFSIINFNMPTKVKNIPTPDSAVKILLYLRPFVSIQAITGIMPIIANAANTAGNAKKSMFWTHRSGGSSLGVSV
jgi:hypothetical protein